MDVIFGLLCFGFLLYFLVINPIKESNERKEREKQQEQQRQRHERIEAANKLMLKYRKGASSLCKKHPEWQAEDFYYHSNEVIAEHHRIEAEEKRQAREARLAEIRKRQDEERKKQQEEYNTLKALYPRGVRYAVNYKGWNISDCLNHQADIKEYERVEREKERKQEQEEAERRRKQQEKESALQYINNAVANWGRARGEVPVYSLFYYYPTTCTDVLIDPKKQLVRKMIWNFKDGIYSPISRCVENVFEHFFGRERLKYITFFLLKGFAKVGAEIGLFCLSYNLRRAISLRGVPVLVAALR